MCDATGRSVSSSKLSMASEISAVNKNSGGMDSGAGATTTPGAWLPVARTRVGLAACVERQQGGQRTSAAPFDWP
jgi:hypothetical protein